MMFYRKRSSDDPATEAAKRPKIDPIQNQARTISKDILSSSSTL